MGLRAQPLRGEGRPRERPPGGPRVCTEQQSPPLSGAGVWRKGEETEASGGCGVCGLLPRKDPAQNVPPCCPPASDGETGPAKPQSPCLGTYLTVIVTSYEVCCECERPPHSLAPSFPGVTAGRPGVSHHEKQLQNHLGAVLCVPTLPAPLSVALLSCGEAPMAGCPGEGLGGGGCRRRQGLGVGWSQAGRVTFLGLSFRVCTYFPALTPSSGTGSGGK